MIFLRLIWSYIKIGLFGFGGGYAMLSLIENEIVNPGWISEKMFTDIVAISQMTPGPIGINSATYIGYVVPGEAGYTGPLWAILGSVICTVVVILPSFLLVTYTSRFIRQHHNSSAIRGMFMALRPVVVGLIASAALLLMNGANFGNETSDISLSIIICIVSFCLVYFTRLHPIFIIILAGISGLIIY